MNILGIFKEYEIESSQESSTWFNGHAYFPFHTYRVLFSHQGWNISVVYEHKESEFTKNNSLHSAYTERHIVSLKAISTTENDFANFKISFLDSFQSIFNFKDSSFRVKCSNKELVEELVRLKELDLVSKMVLSEPDFCPEILGVKNDNQYELNLNFQMSSDSLSQLDLSFKLIMKLMNILNPSKEGRNRIIS